MKRSNTPDACDRFLDHLHEVLDGAEPFVALQQDRHLDACSPCRERVAAAKLLAAWRPASPRVPAGFAERLASAATVEVRRQSHEVWAVRFSMLALAASLLIGIWFAWPQPNAKVPMQPLELAAVSGGLKKPLNDVRDAIAALSTKAVEESYTPAANLFTFTAAESKVEPVAASSPLADFPDAAKAGFEPLLNTPKRALNLFLRDVGGVAGSRKIKS